MRSTAPCSHAPSSRARRTRARGGRGLSTHPTDADRERHALPVLEALRDAVAGGEPEALAALYDEAVPWLGPDGVTEGARAAAERHLALAARAVRWEAPQQRGARAVLRWSGPGPGEGGALVVEIRRGVVVFAAEA